MSLPDNRGRKKPAKELTVKNTGSDNTSKLNTPKKLFERILDIVYSEEGEFIYLNDVELIDKKTKQLIKGKPLVSVRIKIPRADALATAYVRHLIQDKKMLLDFIDRDTGRAVGITKQPGSSGIKDSGFTVIIK